jgi:antitoxin FitA
MSKTIQIRDIDDEVYAGLRRRAAEEGLSVPELMRGEATRLASGPSIAAWLKSTRRRSSAIGTHDVLEALDALRDAGR